MRETRCKTVDGVFIPGCWGAAIYGKHACYCPRRSVHTELKRLRRRVRKLEQQFARSTQRRNAE